MHRILSALAFAVVAVAALGTAHAQPDPIPCTIEDPSPGQAGSFEVVVSDGADAVELEGFATSSGRSGVGWSAQLMTPGGENTVLFLTEDAGRPEPGTYRFVDYVTVDASPPPGKYTASIALAGDILGASGYFSVEGRLEIVASSPSAVAGCLDLRAADLPRTRSVHVQGRFVGRNEDL